MKLAIVIPVFNEGVVIRELIESLPKKIDGIDKIVVIAVNDGSTDNSSDEIRKTKALLVEHPINMGAGAATVTGLEAASKIGADLAITLDGDGQHDPKDIQKLVKPILQNRADLVIGVRSQKSSQMPAIKKIGNAGLNLITYALSRTWTTDSQSGFKCFSREAIDKLEVEGFGYEFCSEIIMEAKRKNIRIAEVPISVIYSEYSKKKGQSIFNGTNIVLKLLFKKLTKSL